MCKCILFIVLQVSFGISVLFAQHGNRYKPWIWTSEPPEDCPFEISNEIVGVALTKNYRHYKLKNGSSIADTWYPTWAANDTLYSPWTDGRCPRLDGSWDQSQSGHINYNKEHVYNSEGKQPLKATTGQAVMVGDNTLNLHIYSLGTYNGNPTWTTEFKEIKPLVDWNNNCGCVTMTYNAPLKKYLLTITDGWPTVAKMNSYILESDKITGPWKFVAYLKA